MDQLSFESIETKSFHEKVSEAIKKETASLETLSNYIEVVELKDGSLSIKANKQSAVKITIRKNYFYIECKPEYAILFDDCEIQKANNGSNKVIFDAEEDVLSHAKQLSRIAVGVLTNSSNNSFGCCGRYIECSDAKKCVNPDKLLALACAYRKNLEGGAIFYGKNKNC